MSGKCPLTTAPAATTQLSPITVPSKTVTLAPIQQFLPILTPTPLTPCFLIGIDKSEKMWFSGLKKRNSRIIYKTLEFPDVASHKVLWISSAAAFTKHFDELSVN